MQLRHAATTDTGRTRDHNEDTYVLEPNPSRVEAGALFVVCDGMGGFAAGEVASELAATTISAHYYAMPEHDPVAALQAAFQQANKRVWQEGHGKMGTTGVAALFLDEDVILANVGDSRAYLVRGGRLRQLTHDHSFVAEQVSAGVLTDDEARRSSYRHVITRALGHRPEVEVDLFQERLQPADRILLCSDGLSGLVDGDDLIELSSASSLHDSVSDLVALANERGGSDNITAILIEVVSVTPGRKVALPPPTARSAATVARAGGGTERLPRGGAQAAVVEKRAVAPARRPVAAPPPVQVTPRRGPLFGMLLVTVLALFVLGGIGYAFVTGGFEMDTPPTPPPIVTLTPVGSSVGAPEETISPQPTLVPTTPPAVTPDAVETSPQP